MKSLIRTASILPILALSGCGDGSSGPADAAVADASAPDAATVPAFTLYDYLIAVDVSPDGRLAVFEDFVGADVVAEMLDTTTGTITPVVVGDPSFDLATGVANGGRLTALHGDPVQAGVYTDGSWQDLVSPHAVGCDNNVASAWDVSGDGHVVVGMAWNGCNPDAFRWSDTTGVLTSLDVIGAAQGGTGLPSNRATVVSDDGTTAAGFASTANLDRSPAIWAEDGSGTLLDTSGGDTPGEVLSIDADGGVAAGTFGYDGFVWTSATGMVTLARPDISLPSDPVFPNAMTSDGATIYGGVGDAFSGVPIAAVWDANGVRTLADVAAAAGVTIPDGVTLGNVLGVSADGTVLIGTAMDASFNTKTFLLRLPG